jgi:hypothetical protein
MNGQYYRYICVAADVKMAVDDDDDDDEMMR